MNRSRALLAVPVLGLLAPNVAAAQEIAAEPPAPAQLAELFDIDRQLPAIAQSLDGIADVFDAQLAEAILAAVHVQTTWQPLPAKPKPDLRLTALPRLADAGPGLAALGRGSLDSPVLIDWSQQLDGPTLAGRLGIGHSDGPIEVRFDLNSRVPLATPLAARFSYDSSAWVRVLPSLKLGAVASGPLDALASRRSEQAIGPEARLTLPGLGGALDAAAGWRMPVRESQRGAGGQPGVLSWSLSFRRPL